MTQKDILKQYFGFDSFRPGQEEIINAILDGHNTLAVLPTGGGKSLCYQVPALMGKSFSIVISPLIALMKDQVDSANRVLEFASFINSTLGFAESEKVLSSILEGKTKLLYIAPEKLDNIEFAERIKNLKPEYLFIDEAHCISEWGHNFRPSYRRIKGFAEYAGLKKISGFTATATPEVRDDIVKQLGMDSPRIFIRGFERENLNIRVINTSEKKEKTLEIIGASGKPAIIYTSTRRNAEDVNRFLKLNGYNSEFYHAGLSGEYRKFIQDEFIKGSIDVIAATNAFGMGIDKSDIRTVIHYNMPGTLENYYQEIGRAGRDGNESDIFLLFEGRDIGLQEFFIRNAYPSPQQIKFIYNAICDNNRITVGSKPLGSIKLNKALRDYLTTNEISAALLQSAVNILVEEGYFSQAGELNKNYKARFLLDREELKAYVKKIAAGETKKLILFVLKLYGTAILEKPVPLDTEKIRLNTKLGDDTIKDILERLENTGIISLEKPSLQSAIFMAKPRVRPDAMQIDFRKLSLQQEVAEHKLRRMTDFCYSKECRFKYILEYFGEETGDYKCGKCDNCGNDGKVIFNADDFIDEKILQTLHESKGTLQLKHLIRILTGNSDRPSLREFTTFESCSHFKKTEMENALQRLERTGYISCIGENYFLDKRGKDFFTGDKHFEKEIKPVKKEVNRESLELFKRLKEARDISSRRFSQNPEMICPDEILKKVSVAAPETKAEMLEVEGFTSRMFNKTGEEFLHAITEFKTVSKKRETTTTAVKSGTLPDNIITVKNLLEKGYNLPYISSVTGLPEAVVSMQIETLISYEPAIDTGHIFTKKELELINALLEDGYTNMKEMKEKLPNTITYAKIRIAMAKYKSSVRK